MRRMTVFHIDYFKVTRSALQNAASNTALILTTETLVEEKPVKKPAAPAGGCGDVGGPTRAINLALACVSFLLRKGARRSGPDPERGLVSPRYERVTPSASLGYA